ncbi:MAG: hypothetical protein AAFS12_07885 [Cyanobacteria bacterium J06632_19]
MRAISPSPCEGEGWGEVENLWLIGRARMPRTLTGRTSPRQVLSIPQQFHQFTLIVGCVRARINIV